MDRPQARRPLLALFLAVLIFAAAEFAFDPLTWYVRLLGSLVGAWAGVITLQWMFADYVESFVLYKSAYVRTPASETARAMQGLDPEALKLMGHMHTLKVAIIPGDEPEVIISGTTLMLDQFLHYLDACNNFRLISVRDYSDRTQFPNRAGASEFVAYCVSRGWAIPAREGAQNEPAMWVSGHNRWTVRAQFGSLLGVDPRAGDTQEGVDVSGGALQEIKT